MCLVLSAASSYSRQNSAAIAVSERHANIDIPRATEWYCATGPPGLNRRATRSSKNFASRNIDLSRSIWCDRHHISSDFAMWARYESKLFPFVAWITDQMAGICWALGTPHASLSFAI